MVKTIKNITKLENGKFLAIDNSYGQNWKREFENKKEALNWLDIDPEITDEIGRDYNLSEG